jgi:hypothetical protein
VELRTGREEWGIYVNAGRPEQIAALRAFLAEHVGAEVVSDGGRSLVMRLMRDVAEEADEGMYAPDIVDSVTGRHFYIVDPPGYMAEPAAHLCLLFCFGMLARYYPDVWMGVLDENVLVAELIGTVLDTIERKFPALVLDQMTGIKHYVELQ